MSLGMMARFGGKMSKEKTVKLNEKQVELLKEAITNQKVFERIKVVSTAENQKREITINRIYEYENLEKKLN